MILREDEGDIAVLRMSHGKVQALDLELIEALSRELSELAAAPPAALVLTGTGSSFSAGVDLFRVIESGRDYIVPFLAGLSRCLRALFAFPRPAVAALNGHALAGGLVLADACDLRVLARGKARLGVPELLVGVAFPAAALEITRFATPSRYTNDLVYRGRRFSAEEALEGGLVHELVESDNLMPRALALARELGALEPAAFTLAKLQLRRSVLETLDQHGPAHDAAVVEQWCRPQTRAAIAAYLERTVGKA